MKDKRQRMAVTWPYGIPPDPQIYAYLAAAAASYPYGLPNPATAYPSLPLTGFYPTPTSSAFSPLNHSAPMKPMFDFPVSLGGSSALDRLTTSLASSSEASHMDSLSHRFKADGLPSMSSLKSSCPCGLPTCSLSSGLHPSFPTSLPSSMPSNLHPGLHHPMTSLPGYMHHGLNQMFQKGELSKQ